MPPSISGWRIPKSSVSRVRNTAPPIAQDATAEFARSCATSVSVSARAARYSRSIASIRRLAGTTASATMAAFEAAVADGAERFVVVADGRGLLEFTLGDLDADAVTLTLGPALSAREAAVVAAVLAGRPWPDLDRRPAAVGEVWTTALAVHVCGSWLAAPPDIAPSEGLSIEGGLVVQQPTSATDADRPATLGRLLEAQGWLATDDQLVLWDGVDVRTGDTCPDGSEATVRWSVDGDDRAGDPSDTRLGHRQVIVLSFDAADAVPVDEPPVSATLPIPQLTAAGGG